MWPMLLSCGSFGLRSVTVFEGLGALAAFLYLRCRRQRLGLDLDGFWALVLALMPGVFAGGIGTYTVLYGPGLAVNLDRLLRGQVSGGSFFGVFWGAAAAAFLFCRSRRLSFAPIADALGAGSALGLVLMRLGCLLNGCCYGRPTGRSWGIVFRDPASRVPRDLLGVPLHPTQLYEAGGAALIFLLLHWAMTPRIQRGASRPGSAFLLCVASYAALRFMEDFFRASDPGLLTLAGFTTAQLLSILTLAGAGGFWLAQHKAH